VFSVIARAIDNRPYGLCAAQTRFQFTDLKQRGEMVFSDDLRRGRTTARLLPAEDDKPQRAENNISSS
jgi:hypothetical protein